MKYIQCPNSMLVGDLRKDRLFLAGGITNCPDWQKEAASLLKGTNMVVINPRRKVFDMTVKGEEQILWERKHLKNANHILFWFPKETVCPITLFELGYYLGVFEREGYFGPAIFIGTHPEYTRRHDVRIQAELCGYGTHNPTGYPQYISNNVPDLVQRVIDWTKVKYK